MPDDPRPSIAFPAFQTPAGLLPQSDREHRSDYAGTQNLSAELSRRTDGYWLDLPYSAGRYFGYQTGLWVVEKKHVAFARYRVMGSELHLAFRLGGSVQNAGAPILQIRLPERFKARQYTFAVGEGTDATGNGIIHLYVGPGAHTISVYRFNFAAWSVGAIDMSAQMIVEVEEAP